MEYIDCMLLVWLSARGVVVATLRLHVTTVVIFEGFWTWFS